MSSKLEMEQAEERHEVSDMQRPGCRIYTEVDRLRLLLDLSLELRRPGKVRYSQTAAKEHIPGNVRHQSAPPEVLQQSRLQVEAPALSAQRSPAHTCRRCD